MVSERDDPRALWRIADQLFVLDDLTHDQRRALAIEIRGIGYRLEAFYSRLEEALGITVTR